MVAAPSDIQPDFNAMKKLPAVLCLLILAGFLAGCSTPATRINRNLALFNSLPASDQELVKQGRVAVGFTTDAVRLALGDPDRIYTRTDVGGQSESWVYSTWSSRGGGMIYYRGYYHHGFPGMYHYWMDFDDREEVERFRVIIKDGKVTAVEEMRRS